MKKLTKMGIDALRETLPVLSREEQSSYMGMYAGDCFWRCVAFLSSGDFSEAGAEVYAWGYFQDRYENHCAAYEHLKVTSWVYPLEASDYLSQNSYLRMTGMEIACVNPSYFSGYTEYCGHLHQSINGGVVYNQSGHYMVIMPGMGPDGSRLVIDPTYNVQFRISSEEYDDYVIGSII